VGGRIFRLGRGWNHGKASQLEPWQYLYRIPNYLNDLNAMHEAEKMLWGMDWSNRYTFNDNLANILKGRTVNRNEWDAETLLDATAAQRAEAFLRTIDKWTTNQNEA
jgi:hypothetical protein